MNKALIYGLYNSEKPVEIRYVGKTKSKLSTRLYQHVYDTKKHPTHNKKKSNWINKVFRSGGKVKIKLLLDSEDYTIDEPIIIKQLLSEGHKLTNIAPGGEKTKPTNWRPTPESIAKQLATKEARGVNKPNIGSFGSSLKNKTSEMTEKGKLTKLSKRPKVIIDGVKYNSQQEALEILNLNYFTFYARVKAGTMSLIKK